MEGGLLLTLIILFSFQGETILNNPLHILLIAVPLVVQTVLIFFVAYGWSKRWKLPHDVAAPAGMIGASNQGIQLDLPSLISQQSSLPVV